MKRLLVSLALLLPGCLIDDYYVEKAPSPATMGPAPECGDKRADPGEECDGTDLKGLTCASFDDATGTLTCTANCLLDKSGCVPPVSCGDECVTEPKCGDGKAEGTEVCDGDDLKGQTCEDEGFDQGTLGCSSGCTLDTTDCEMAPPDPPDPYCGDDEADADEECDGDDLKQKDCQSEGYESGSLSCSGSCVLVTTACVSPPATTCGDSVAEGDEQCDDADLDGATCPAEGFAGGVIACGSDCTLDTELCTMGDSCDYDGGSRTGVVLRADTSMETSRVGQWSCANGGAGPDVSVTWTAPASGCYQLMTSSDNDLDTILGVFEDCSFSTPIACDDNSGGDQFSLLEFDATAGTTYAVVADSYFNSDSGPIQVRVTPCVPPEWLCIEAAYGRGDGCDCGCGVLDPDCAGDESAAACTFCVAPGSCAEVTGCSAIDADENFKCD